MAEPISLPLAHVRGVIINPLCLQWWRGTSQAGHSEHGGGEMEVSASLSQGQRSGQTAHCWTPLTTSSTPRSRKSWKLTNWWPVMQIQCSTSSIWASWLKSQCWGVIQCHEACSPARVSTERYDLLSTNHRWHWVHKGQSEGRSGMGSPLETCQSR